MTCDHIGYKKYRSNFQEFIKNQPSFLEFDRNINE